MSCSSIQCSDAGEARTHCLSVSCQNIKMMSKKIFTIVYNVFFFSSKPVYIYRTKMLRYKDVLKNMLRVHI